MLTFIKKLPWSAMLILALVVTVWSLISTSNKLAVSNDQLEKARMSEARLAGKYEGQLGALRNTIEQRDARIRELTVVAEEAEDSTNEAIEDHPDWAGTLTPDSVRFRVCEYVNCTDRDPNP